MRLTLRLLVACCFFLCGSRMLAQPPKMKFNEVREVAPGVFFRYASISATDPSVFGGCNNMWVVFDDYVLVFDANFPKEAGDVIKAIRKTTKKPIRYVVDSHHHGDHAYGNAVWAKEGASIIAQAYCNHWLRSRGPDEFAKAGKGPTGRKDIARSKLKVPDIVFRDRLVFDDGKQRAELVYFGHCHTPGDAGLYLPKHKILCTGDACLNGAFNYTGHSNTASWIRNLEKMQQLDIKMVLPGHGPPATKKLLAKQRRYFVELRAQVKKGIDAGKDLEDFKKSISMPWYKKWTGVAAKDRVENIEHVYGELTGRVFNWNLAKDFSIYQAITPTKKIPGWKQPRRIVIPNLMPDKLNELKRIAPDIYFIPVRTAKEAAKEASDADAVLGFVTPEILKAGGTLRWLQIGPGGVNDNMRRQLSKSKITVTDVRHVDGVDAAEQAFALMLALTRSLDAGVMKLIHLPKTRIIDTNKRWNHLKLRARPGELRGKTMLVIGLSSTGKQISKRANAFGMRVMAIDTKSRQHRPDYVFSLDGFDQLMKRLSQANVVVLACPLTIKTKAVLGASQFKVMKSSAILINVARGGLVDYEALADALRSKQLAAVGLDVTDPEPLPNDHRLWKRPNVVITPHQGGASPEARARQWELWKENVRRFAGGEPLLCVLER